METRTLTLSIEESGARVDHLVHDSHDDRTHYTTAFSCDCAEFVRRGACLHHVFLLDSLGWLPAMVAVNVEMERPR